MVEMGREDGRKERKLDRERKGKKWMRMGEFELIEGKD